MAKTPSDASRTTSTGMFRYALEFFAAGIVTDDQLAGKESHTLTPANYLVGHSIELVFKAYLL
jgi:hypothetical protein